MPDADLTIAVAQTESVQGAVPANVAITCALAAQAAEAGAALVLFPELSLVGYQLDQLVDRDLWLTENDPRLDRVRTVARDHRIVIVVGAPVLLGDGRRCLGVVAIGPDELELMHPKQHLHGREFEFFDPAPPSDLTLVVGGWTLALAVCFDVAVPAHAAHAAGLGAHAYLASALYVEGEERRVDVHFASRAMDYRMYSVLANHSGSGPLGRSIGGSGAWSPSGDRMHAAGSDPELVMITLDHREIERYR